MGVCIIELTTLILDFIAILITSWPFVILVIVVFFHKEIGDNITKIFDLLTRVKSLSAGDKSITFSEQLANIDHDNVEQSQQESNLEIKPEWGFTPQDEFEKLALLRPDFAILDSWQPIEKRLSQIADNELKNLRTLSPVHILNILAKKQMISTNHVHYIRELMVLRNKVVHNDFQSITTNDADIYRGNCLEAMQILDSIHLDQ